MANKQNLHSIYFILILCGILLFVPVIIRKTVAESFTRQIWSLVVLVLRRLMISWDLDRRWRTQEREFIGKLDYKWGKYSKVSLQVGEQAVRTVFENKQEHRLPTIHRYLRKIWASKNSQDKKKKKSHRITSSTGIDITKDKEDVPNKTRLQVGRQSK